MRRVDPAAARRPDQQRAVSAAVDEQVRFYPRSGLGQDSGNIVALPLHLDDLVGEMLDTEALDCMPGQQCRQLGRVQMVGVVQSARIWRHRRLPGSERRSTDCRLRSHHIRK